jgi:hypothetical protein
VGYIAIGAARDLKVQRRGAFRGQISQNPLQSLVICPVLVEGDDADANRLILTSAIILGRT